MNLLSVNKLSRMGRELPLFTDITFGLDDGEKVALIGKNGSGKSTLLACITGRVTPDTGTAVINRDSGVSVLEQNPVFLPNATIRDHIFASDSPKLHLIREYESCCEQFARGEKVADKLEKLTSEMDAKNVWNYEQQIRSILTTLGITDLNLLMGSLSGGMAKKVSLAQVLIEDTRLILLDEPTNHLDIATIAWLEDYLRTTDRSVLMVTHDRYFLDAVCTSIMELEFGNITKYEGNFSQYLDKKALAIEIAANTDARIESVLRSEREWLMRGPKARGTKAQARIDSIHEKMDKLAFSKEQLAQNKTFAFEISGRRLGGKILEAKDISKAWPSPEGKLRTVIDTFSYEFSKGERIGVFGDNGSGKTTLLNILTKSIEPDSGKIIAGENTCIAYYCQNPVFPDLKMSVLEYIQEIAEVITQPNGKTVSASKMLEEFGFEGKIQYSPVSTLSGGERKRLYLVRLLMSNPNFLILDEPTNDFDIYTMSVLESFLASFAGCLLVVSHDRYFMDKVADTLFVVEENGSITGFAGTCSDYLLFLSETKNSKIETKNTKKSPTEPPTDSQKALSSPSKKRSYKEQKEFESIESEIEILEAKKNNLEALLGSGETDHKKLKDYALQLEKNQSLLEEKYERWEFLASF